jgi:hypothetical protein
MLLKQSWLLLLLLELRIWHRIDAGMIRLLRDCKHILGDVQLRRLVILLVLFDRL